MGKRSIAYQYFSVFSRGTETFYAVRRERAALAWNSFRVSVAQSAPP